MILFIFLFYFVYKGAATFEHRESETTNQFSNMRIDNNGGHAMNGVRFYFLFRFCLPSVPFQVFVYNFDLINKKSNYPLFLNLKCSWYTKTCCYTGKQKLQLFVYILFTCFVYLGQTSRRIPTFRTPEGADFHHKSRSRVHHEGRKYVESKGQIASARQRPCIL